MRCSAEIPGVRSGEPLGSRHMGLMAPDAKGWICPELEPHGGPTEPAVVPRVGSSTAEPCPAV